MASECKLCVSLGVTTLTDVSETKEVHVEFHRRQVYLITHSEDFIIDKRRTIKQESVANARTGKVKKEELGKSGLLKFCRKLVNIHGRDCSIKCSQCERSIRPGQCTANTASSLINHATIHLNLDLFGCRQCDLKFVSRSGVRAHLYQIHAISAISANYIDMTEDHLGDIMDVVKLCFDKAPQRQLNVTKFGKQKRNWRGQTPLSKIAYSLLSHQREDHIQCHMCTRSIPNNQNSTAKLVEHAQWHLDKPIFTCGLCQHTACSEDRIRDHLGRKHFVARSQQNFKDASIEHYEEISSMLGDCFGEKKERPSVLTREQERARHMQSRIRNQYGTNSHLTERKVRCTELVHKFQKSGKLECRICQEQISALPVKLPMQHACSHFDKQLFTCRRCPYSSTTKPIMGMHVRSKHGVPITDGFDDHTDDFHSDFKEMLSKCFYWDMEPEDSVRGTLAPKSNKLKILSKMHGNHLKAARHLHVYELARKHGKEGKIICRICSHETKSRYRSDSINSQLLFTHAMTHLGRQDWPFLCKLCSHMTSNRLSMNHHVKNAHDKGIEGFEDVSDKFHAEIMAVLSKCYDYSV